MRAVRMALVGVVVAGSWAAVPPAVAAASTQQVAMFETSVYISPASGQDGVESANDLYVDVYHDKVITTERSNEVTLAVHPQSGAGCSKSGDAVTCTNASLGTVNTLTASGDDVIEWAVPTTTEGRLSYVTDCGPGYDKVIFSDGTSATTVAGQGETTNCEYVEVNGHVIKDEDPGPSDPPLVPFAETDGLVRVPKPSVTFEPACPGTRTSCGSFEYTYLSQAQAALTKSKLNRRVTIKKLTTEKAVEDILKPFVKAGTVDRINNYVDGQVIKQTTVIDKAFYKKYKSKPTYHRISTFAVPYETTLWVYAEPVPDPPGACPYATGVYTDIDPKTKGKQSYDVEAELVGPKGSNSGVTPEFAEQALKSKFKCPKVTVLRTPRPGSKLAQPMVTAIDFDKTAKSVTVKADVPARSDLVMQISGRSRADWLENPGLNEMFDGELGPLVDGTFALAPKNLTSINVRLYERSTGRAVIAAGSTMILDSDGKVLASQSSGGIGDATLTLPLRTTGLISIVSAVQTAGGQSMTAYAVRRVVDAGATVATARGAVFTRDAEGAYQRDTTTALSGTTLSAAQGAMQRMMDLLRGAPSGTGAAQAKAIVNANVGLQSTKPTAVLRKVHEMTGFELASMHVNVTAKDDDVLRIAAPMVGAVVISPAQVAASNGLTGLFVAAVRGAPSGVTQVLTGPMSTLLGGNTELGMGVGGLIANGDWISDQGPAPRQSATAARRGLGDWFTQIVNVVRSVGASVATTVQRIGASIKAGAEAVARVFVGGGASSGTTVVAGTAVLLPPKVTGVPALLPVKVTTMTAQQLKGVRIVAAGGGNLRDNSGKLVGNDGASLVGNDGSSLVAKLNGALIGNDGSTLIGNDGSTLVGNDGGSLLANEGGSLSSAVPVGLIANDGAGLIANDGAGLIANDGAGVVAGGAGN